MRSRPAAWPAEKPPPDLDVVISPQDVSAAAAETAAVGTETQREGAGAGPAASETVLGWALRASAVDERCSACGRTAPELHQEQRFVGRQWDDVPGLVLCVQCFHARSTRGVGGPAAQWGDA